MRYSGDIIYHIIAFMVVAVWGSTFVFTKMLLMAGLSPTQIFTLRFALAYMLMAGWCIADGKWQTFTRSWRDEMLMIALGITGGTLYFTTENVALLYTTATNAALIVCSCPLFAMLLSALIYRHKRIVTRRRATGSLMAFMGMAVVVLNGQFVLHLSPKGDLLAFSACLSWAVYSLLMKQATQRYSPLLVTRKVFFYGLLGIMPYYLLFPHETWIFHWGEEHTQQVFTTGVIGNLLFLGIVASMAAFLIWSWIITKLGTIVATNWIYFNPITTILFANWMLREQITPWFIIGTILILTGMYMCNHATQKEKSAG